MPRPLRSLLLCALAAWPGAATIGAEPVAAQDPASRAPDARRGEALYVGSSRLLAGGAPCLACHGIAGHGLSRAASFGPDLSGAYAQYGADGLDGLLEDIVFPSMQPVYRGHAVTKEERQDLVAFLGASAPGRPARLGPAFAAGVAGAMGIFLAGVVLVGRRGSGRRARAAGRTS
jgi:mono/diheme cytochrome c family protein